MLAAAVSVLLATGCDRSTNVVTGRPDLEGVHLTVGSTRMDDGVLLAELYAQALEARGAAVTRRNTLATRSDYYPLLEQGTLDVVPERTHELLHWLDPRSASTAKTVAGQMSALSVALSPSLTVLSPSAATDQQGIACRGAVADRHDLRTFSDLQHTSTRLVIGVSPEARDVFAPVLVRHEIVPLSDPVALADAIHEGTVDCGTVRTTEPRISRDRDVVLDDDQLRAPSDAIVPLVARTHATPAVQAVLDAVSSTLDGSSLRTLLAQVELEGKRPADVVRDWIAANGLGG